MERIIEKLQSDAIKFLTKSKLIFNGLVILPKEIEIYYNKEGEFEDNSVHKNQLQQNNKNHFYVHRWGKLSSDPYKGGNYPGLDFVVSDETNVYYSYLIRSALIRSAAVNDKPIVGPHKVLEAISSAVHLEYKEMESLMVEVASNNVSCEVLFSTRINLGKKVDEQYLNSKLRAVLCDEWFLHSKYPHKEKLVVGLLSENVHKGNMTSSDIRDFAKKYLGYIPSSIKNL